MNAAPRYSVIVPTFNREASVHRTLSSVLGQSITDLEIIVVDDGSSDATLQVLAAIDDPRLSVVSQANAGPAAARNHGMRIAHGRYLAFLDSDDCWYPDFLAAVDTEFAQHPDALVYGQIVVDRGVGRYWIKPDRALATDESIYDFLYVHGGFIQTSTIVVPASLRHTVQWDESVTFGDNDQFAIDCWRTGMPFRMLAEPLVLYEDAMNPNALSQLPVFGGGSDKHTNFFRWMETQRDAMSEQAWIGFRARFLSVALARTAPLESLACLRDACRAGALGPAGVARQLVQNYSPRNYRRLTDLYVRLRGRRLSLPGDR